MRTREVLFRRLYIRHIRGIFDQICGHFWSIIRSFFLSTFTLSSVKLLFLGIGMMWMLQMFPIYHKLPAVPTLPFLLFFWKDIHFKSYSNDVSMMSFWAHDDAITSNGSKIVFLLSMFLNCMLLAVIGKYDGLKNPLRMLLLNLASVDLVATTLGNK